MMKFIASTMLATVAANSVVVPANSATVTVSTKNGQDPNLVSTVKAIKIEAPTGYAYVYGQQYDAALDDSKCCSPHGCYCGSTTEGGDYQAMNENACCKFWCPMYYIWTYPGQCTAGWVAWGLGLLGWFPAIVYVWCCWSPPTHYRRAGAGCCESMCNGRPNTEGAGCWSWPCCMCCSYCGWCGGMPPIVKITKVVVAHSSSFYGGAFEKVSSSPVKSLFAFLLLVAAAFGYLTVHKKKEEQKVEAIAMREGIAGEETTMYGASQEEFEQRL